MPQHILENMKISTASCLLPLALVANAAPSVRKAAYTLFDNVNCLRDSSYSRYVFDSEVNECWNFAEASISVDLRELAEGCQRKLCFTFNIS